MTRPVTGASADADRATLASHQAPAGLGLSVGIPSALSDDNSIEAGFEAHERGEPFDKFQYAKWQEGWFVARHAREWKTLADAMGAKCRGFSFDRSASFSWPDGSTSEISGGLNRYLRQVHTQPPPPRSDTMNEGEG